MAKAKIKASQIRQAMSQRWTPPEWAIMWEVANATGSGARRYADAVMMPLWPSRGLELQGVEIKVSRSDWKREAAARGNAVWAVPFFGDSFGETERATYIASLQAVGDGLSLFIENEELRTFLEGVLQAELQSAPNIIVGKSL